MTTYTWTLPAGTAGSANVAADWSPSGGPQNPGDAGVLTNGGTMLLADLTLQQNTIVLGAGTMVFSGDSSISFANPTFDNATVLTTATGPGAAASTVQALGNFVNEGSILADGSAGSSLTINIGTTTVGGTATAGYFVSSDLIEADAGNSLTINVGDNAALFNSGQILANGGTIVINVASAAIAGGYAPVLGVVEIAGGGTVETQAAYASTVTGTAPFYAFGDTVAGDTLKIDNILSFGGRILNLQAGDVIDLGTSLAITGLSFSTVTGILQLAGAGNTVLASLAMANGNFQSTNGSIVALSDGAAAGFSIGTNPAGDTTLTATGTIPATTNTSGTWQDAGSWAGGAVPGTTSNPDIGLATSPGGPVSDFTLTTGSVAVTVQGFDIFDHHATLDITSNTTATAAVIDDISGAIEVTAGNTLTTHGLRTFEANASVKVDGGATVVVTGHPSLSLASSNGVLTATTNNEFGAQFNGGTTEVDGSLLAGPTSVGGTVTGGGQIQVGFGGNGSANMTVNGATGTVTDTSLILGSDPTGSGTLTLIGTGASWTDMLVPGTLDTGSDHGTVLIGDNGQSGDTPVGFAAPLNQGPAQLVITNGATMTEQEAGFIGYTANTTGNVSVTNGGVWNIAAAPAGEVITNAITTTAGAGFLEVGRAGTGTLSILNGGTVEAGVQGSFLGNGTSFAAGGIQIGESVGSSGSVLVSGAASLLTSADGIAVGDGGTGSLTVVNGGSVSVSLTGISIGNTAGAVGSVEVGGAAILTLGTATGGIAIGRSGTGTLEIDSLGTVSLNGTTGIGIGQLSTGNGALIVDGGLLNMGTTTSGIGVGQGGTSATMLIENSGTVLLQGGGISVATTATADSGTLTIDSNGLLKTTGSTSAIFIGRSGNGVLIVSNGGSVSDANALQVGSTAGASGSVSVTNAAITAASLVLDAAAGAASGTVSIGAGGLVSLAGTTSINNNGTVALSGGTLAVATAGGGAGLSIQTGGLISGFGKVTIGTGAGLLNNGQINASGGTLEMAQGAGTMNIASGAELQVDLLPLSGSINFSAGLPETFFIDAPVGTTNTFSLNNWSDFDTLAFDTADTLTSAGLVNGNTLVVDWTNGVSNGSDSFTNVNLAAGSATSFSVSNHAGVGSVQLACFAEGTRIRTARGPVAVEHLQAGDMVPLATGGVAEAIVWIGHTRVNCRAHPDPQSVWPVRVAAHAFGPGLPVRDLYLSPDHAVFVNHVLVPVKHLINGGSIMQVRRDRVTWYHVELARHEVILAEDLPVESYLDVGDRANFANSGNEVRLHPDFTFRLTAATALLWEARGAAPLVQAGAALDAARAAVAEWGPARQSA